MPVITSCYLQDQVPLILSNGAVSKLRSQGLDYVLIAKSLPFQLPIQFFGVFESGRMGIQSNNFASQQILH